MREAGWGPFESRTLRHCR